MGGEHFDITLFSKAKLKKHSFEASEARMNGIGSFSSDEAEDLDDGDPNEIIAFLRKLEAQQASSDDDEE